MKVLEVYNGNKTYMFPTGKLATKEEVLKKFPAALTFTHVAETDENSEVLFALQNLSALRTFYGIDSNLTESEAITAIQEILNVPEPEQEASASDRMAASLEFIALNSLPNETL